MKSSSSDATGRLGISRGMLLLAGLLVVLMLLTVMAFVLHTGQVGNSREHAALASEQRLMSQRLAALSRDAMTGQPAVFVELRRLRDRLDLGLTYLREGDSGRGLPPAPEAVADALRNAESAWSTYRGHVNVLVDNETVIAAVTTHAAALAQGLPRLQLRADTLTDRLAESGIDARLVHLAARQAILAQRMERDLNRILAGDDLAVTAGRLERDAADFQTGLGRLQTGAGLPADVRDLVQEIAAVFSGVRPDVEALLAQTGRLGQVAEASRRIQAQSPALLNAVAALQQDLDQRARSGSLWMYAGYLFALAAVLVLGLLAYLFYQDAQRRLAVTTEQNRRNQRAILRLLDEMTNLAEGDLTVHATVTEDITGAIADSVNYAIDALRSLVTTINQTAMQVSGSAVKTQATALRLADASNLQAREIASASGAITDMADSIEQVSRSAESSADVAKKSVAIASKGALTVRKTIDGMDTIREQIQETSKRIKRLGESSQEIGDIVSLITDIADQTNILALNAAIQASSAGEAGRGFAVVADEVQRLAERSSNASRQIEALVKTIQADTNEAVISMEHSTANVVSGAKLAFDAGDALAEIEGVSHQLAELIATISKAARQQAEAAQNISNTMTVIQEITMQTSDGTNETAVSIGNLANLASELRKSVSGFKLPQSEQLETVVLGPTDTAASGKS
ncbi:methyl-accepting chemotaxis protein [Ectothiorhodospira shaposhnikovii]|uniref:methyl-accepting chemotaxis protein n=1 Tax=Ectothiorhodospira shaposhnikovii TaxID=1054 RepID=UPI001EE7D25B|nr:methyl-accepting chemotaxis protein [Ectothiorhodospira shaposhnikovii]MCG5512274.1 methyl-accepting chemotaxis protein [Ectothiorhodospira shaposhnikovii]